MKNRVLGLFALLLALSLLATGLAFAEGDLEIDAGISTEGYEGLDESVSIDIDGAALVSDDPAATDSAAENASEVPINKANFPAADFGKYLKANYDYDGNGKLSKGEIDDVRSLELRSYEDFENGVGELNCPTLKGIEYFVNLEYLWCPGCNVDTLDLSKNVKLNDLNCSDNHLKKLDLTHNPEIVRLDCYGNQLKKLDLSKNKKLKDLMCGGNPLTALDVSNNTKLTNLWCEDSKLTALDVSKNTALKELMCWDNRLTALNTSKNKKLVILGCENNRLTGLDVSKNTKLEFLLTYGNSIASIDIGKCPELQKALKELKKKTTKKIVEWGVEGEYGWDPHVGIDRTTKLTAGSKVLYPGK